MQPPVRHRRYPDCCWGRYPDPVSQQTSGAEPDSGSRTSRVARSARRIRQRFAAVVRSKPGTGEHEQDLRFLFIVTYGRSGSTLLMGLLNQIPGYLIRGENRAALRHLHNYHRVLMTERERHSAARTQQTTHPWFGIAGVPPDALTDGVRDLAVQTLFRPTPGTQVTGFKEIRWWHKDMEEHVTWLREVFPDARFVINTRQLDKVLQSRWWAEGDREKNEQLLRSADARIRALASDLGEAAYHVHFDDYLADPTVLRGLFDWLGEAWDEAAIRATMAVPHSIPTTRQRDRDT